MGVRHAVNSGDEPDQIAGWKKGRGWFDMMIEASGNAEAALEGMAMVAPEGVVAQVGVFAPGRQPGDFGSFLGKGLRWHGVFRFYKEFGPALAALEDGLINPLPLLSASYPASDCVRALHAAMSPEAAKIQLIFGNA
jgi:L-idonate 5-dehydrogenase